MLSDNGADLQCIIDAAADHVFRGRVDFVVGSTSRDFVLKRAADAGIEHVSFDPEHYADREEFYGLLRDRLNALGIECILLVEFGHLLPDFFVQAFYPNIISVHPSLDSRHIGEFDAGTACAQDVIDDNARVTGCHAHLVQTGPVQPGPTICEERVPVFEGDSIRRIRSRVKKAEHYMIPHLLTAWCEDRIVVDEYGGASIVADE